MSGKLYIVATPLGNLDDLSPRARSVLAQVDLVAAEDTRHSGKLLQHAGVKTPMMSLHEHNERQRINDLLDRLGQGKSIALISDAGTPLISDPGYQLVRAVRDAGVDVIPVPGPSALICALSVAGLPTDRFVFEGFLPAKSGARKKRLAALQTETRTLIFYESTHRIADSLADMREVFGDERTVVIAKEMTKAYETIVSMPLAQAGLWLQEVPERVKGEFVVLVEGAAKADQDEKMQEADRVLGILLESLPTKQSAELTAKITGASKNELYQLALTKKKPETN